jgi:cyclomaltodextrinase
MLEAQSIVHACVQKSAKTQRAVMTSVFIQPGRYRHFKGNEYTVLGVARHSETLEELVVYRAEYGERGLWVRPVAMFLETVQVQGKPTPRFLYVGEAQ